MKQVVLREQLAYRRAPLINPNGLNMLAPILMLYGTEEQQRRHLSGFAACEVQWCQGYSGPGAGSDLAALQIRAVRDGDGEGGSLPGWGVEDDHAVLDVLAAACARELPWPDGETAAWWAWLRRLVPDLPAVDVPDLAALWQVRQVEGRSVQDLVLFLAHRPWRGAAAFGAYLDALVRGEIAQAHRHLRQRLDAATDAAGGADRAVRYTLYTGWRDFPAVVGAWLAAVAGETWTRLHAAWVVARAGEAGQGVGSWTAADARFFARTIAALALLTQATATPDRPAANAAALAALSAICEGVGEPTRRRRLGLLNHAALLLVAVLAALRDWLWTAAQGPSRPPARQARETWGRRRRQDRYRWRRRRGSSRRRCGTTTGHGSSRSCGRSPPYSRCRSARRCRTTGNGERGDREVAHGSDRDHRAGRERGRDGSTPPAEDQARQQRRLDRLLAAGWPLGGAGHASGRSAQVLLRQNPPRGGAETHPSAAGA